MITDKEIQKLINAELKEANEKFPLFNSLHEGQSVLKEEIDETGDEFEDIKDLYRDLWTATKENNLRFALEISDIIQNKAEHLIKESIQVAAMAEKIILSEKKKTDLKSTFIIPEPEDGKQAVYAVDFDGTLCTNEWPEIGLPNIELIENLKALREKGHRVILWTCRDEQRIAEAVGWCKYFGLEFDGVNEPMERMLEAFGGDHSRKIFADYYIDDRNVPGTFAKRI